MADTLTPTTNELQGMALLPGVKPVHIAVVPDEILRDWNYMSRSCTARRKEVAGLVYGTVVDDHLILLRNQELMWGTSTGVALGIEDRYRRSAQNFFAQNLAERIPGTVTVPYHTHPLHRKEEYDAQTLEAAKTDIVAGICNYLRDDGVEPTLEEVLAEKTRELSDDDREARCGRYTILITDTPHRYNRFSRVNVYSIASDSISEALIPCITPRTLPRRLREHAQRCSSIADKTAIESFRYMLDLRRQYDAATEAVGSHNHETSSL